MTSYTVTIPKRAFKEECEVVTWAKANCKSYITNSGIIMERDSDGFGVKWGLEFYFYKEADATWFTLRWS